MQKTVKGSKGPHYIPSPLKDLLRPKDVGDLLCATTPYVGFAGGKMSVSPYRLRAYNYCYAHAYLCIVRIILTARIIITTRRIHPVPPRRRRRARTAGDFGQPALDRTFRVVVPHGVVATVGTAKNRMLHAHRR